MTSHDLRQVSILRVYAIGMWADGVQNSNRRGVGAFTDIMFAVGDTGEMLAARTVCNIVCGGYIALMLGNGVFNGVRLFMCVASIAFLSWQVRSPTISPRSPYDLP